MINRSSLYVFAITLLAFLACDTKDNIPQKNEQTFIKIYGGEYVDRAADLIALDTGGFVILGSTLSAPAGTTGTSWDIIYFITDKQGNIYKQKVIGDPLVDEEPIRILQDADGFIICGNYLKSGQKTGFLLKISPAGDSLYSKTFLPDVTHPDSYEFSDLTGGFDGNSIGLTGITHPGEKFMKTLVYTGNFEEIQSNNIFTKGGNGVNITNYKGIQDPNPPNGTVYLYNLLVNNYTNVNGISIIVSDMGFNDNLLTPSLLSFDAYPVKLIYTPNTQSGHTNEDLFYVLGYLDPVNLTGPYIAKSTVVRSDQNSLDLNMTVKSENKLETASYVNIIPSDMKLTTDGSLILLGTEVETSGNKKIRMLKLTGNFNTNGDYVIQKDKSFGTGYKGDNAVRMDILPDGSVVFLSTVDYQLGKTNTKIALYKLTPDLELDF
jgi:hypothetical protein